MRSPSRAAVTSVSERKEVLLKMQRGYKKTMSEMESLMDYLVESEVA